MAKTAKIFMNGRSQAVRLPKEFRFSGDVVNVSRDPVSGDITLSEVKKKIETWEEFLKFRDSLGQLEDIEFERDTTPLPSDRTGF